MKRARRTSGAPLGAERRRRAFERPRLPGYRGGALGAIELPRYGFR
jgi:hypothetical protein